MGQVLKLSSIPATQLYEPSMTHLFAISDETVGAKGITLAKAVMEPGNRTRNHYHALAELAGYVLSGRCRIVFGGTAEIPAHEEIAEAGDMVYIPAGEAHTFENISDTEPLVLVGGYSAAHGDHTGKTLVEP